MELICPAGTPAALKAAVEAGADAVYCGFRDETNARNFPGLNFSREELRAGIARAHKHGVKVLVAINTFARAGALDVWKRAVDDAVEAGADALIVADVGVLDYAAQRHPDQRLHVSVQAAAANPDAINFYVKAFGARRVVLPRVLSVAEIAAIAREVSCETEIFVFGG
ncbi:MAG: U32 family peptidase, partial [Afipia birgiae]|nr:U32 family peptidase [Afipia birgiae]